MILGVNITSLKFDIVLYDYIATKIIKVLVMVLIDLSFSLMVF